MWEDASGGLFGTEVANTFQMLQDSALASKARDDGRSRTTGQNQAGFESSAALIRVDGAKGQPPILPSYYSVSMI